MYLLYGSLGMRSHTICNKCGLFESPYDIESVYLNLRNLWRYNVIAFGKTFLLGRSRHSTPLLPVTAETRSGDVSEFLVVWVLDLLKNRLVFYVTYFISSS